MENYSHKDVYTRRKGILFTIEICRLSVEDYDPYKEFSRGENRWFVYAYLYPNHPLWEFLKEKSTDNPSWLFNLNVHGNMSYYSVWKDVKCNVTSYELGWDYNHPGDDRFTYYKTPEEARSVFCDADRLYSILSNPDVVNYLQDKDNF